MIDIILDTRQVDAALAHLSHNVDDLSQAMDEIGNVVTSKIQGCFRDAANPAGSPWAELAESTKAKRRNRSMKPLDDTGHLKDSIIHNPSRFEVQIGSKEKYGITHQRGAAKGQYGLSRRGGPIPWGDVPARQFLPTQERGLPLAWENEILAIITRHIEDGV
jgi:phage virion morphogenesis protein